MMLPAPMIVPAPQVRLVVTTAGSREEAERIAEALVTEHVAACVSLAPGIVSTYRWQGETERAEEVLLLIKTVAENVEQVETTLRQLHSYEVPEFLVLHLESASQSYLDWLLHSASPPR